MTQRKKADDDNARRRRRHRFRFWRKKEKKTKPPRRSRGRWSGADRGCRSSGGRCAARSRATNYVGVLWRNRSRRRRGRSEGAKKASEK
ncbi:hypothetical protein L596_016628 [Steinernema carpocapsae]|uniref:Uncharacterized protein n=1 Tax=Steinernema carpocapsae TaxID=34508 RepID=A0A4U5NJU2_STECR|nr:hypothetical protein L596_016628 [Steinernema carpocapsae]